MEESVLQKILERFETRLIELEKRIQGLSPVIIEKEEIPPLGVKPKHIHNLMRQAELVKAMNRYTDVGKKIPTEWVEEYNSLTSDN